MDCRGDIALVFSKDKKIWCNGSHGTDTMFDLWQWAAEKSCGTSTTMLEASRSRDANCYSEGLFLSIRAHVFFLCCRVNAVVLEEKSGDTCTIHSGINRNFAFILFCALSVGCFGGHDIWNYAVMH